MGLSERSMLHSHLSHIDPRSQTRRLHRKDVEISKRASQGASIGQLSSVSTGPMRKVADHLRGRLAFESAYSPCLELFQKPSYAPEPDLRIRRNGTPASKFNRTTHRTDQLDRALYQSKITRFPADGNVIREKAIKPTLFDYGGEVLICSNSAGKNPDNFFYNICTDPNYGFGEFHATTMDNPTLPKPDPEESRAVWSKRRKQFIAELIRDNDPWSTNRNTSLNSSIGPG